MRFEYAFFAQGADVVEGRLHVFGGDINSLTVPTLPARAQIAIVVKFVAEPDENGVVLARGHRLFLQFVRPQKSPETLIAEQDFSAQARSDNKVSGAAIIANCGFQFDEAGEHRVNIFLDDNLVHSLPLYIEAQTQDVVKQTSGFLAEAR